MTTPRPPAKGVTYEDVAFTLWVITAIVGTAVFLLVYGVCYGCYHGGRHVVRAAAQVVCGRSHDMSG